MLRKPGVYVGTYSIYSTFLRGRRNPTGRYKARTTSTDRSSMGSLLLRSACRPGARDTGTWPLTPLRRAARTAHLRPGRPGQKQLAVVVCKIPAPVAASPFVNLKRRHVPQRVPAGQLPCARTAHSREVKTACVHACRPGCVPIRETCWALSRPASCMHSSTAASRRCQ